MAWPGATVLGVGGNRGLDSLGLQDEVWLVGWGWGGDPYSAWLASSYLRSLSLKPKARLQLGRWGSPC